MNKLFTKERSNLGRQKELDLAKGLAIIFMILVHVNETYQSTTIAGGVHNRIIEFLGSPPAAPVFMMLLGVGIVYSKKSTAKVMLKRGISLIIIGYVLNLFREVIPYAILSKVNNDVSYMSDGWDLLWNSDILQFAGLVFIFFSFIKKFKIKNIAIFLIWCGFITLNILLRGKSFDNSVANGIFRLVWGTDGSSYFPFLAWITFPILGYFFGQLLVRCTNKTLFYKNLLIASGAFSIPLWIYSYVNNVSFGAFGELYQVEYYHHDIMGNIVLCTFVLFWISLCYFVGKYIPTMVHKAMARWSKNTNEMYCVHSVLIGFLMLLIEEESYMSLQILILAVFIFIFTDLICIYISNVKVKKRNIKAKENKLETITA